MVVTVRNSANADYYFQKTGLEADADWANGRWFSPSGRLGVSHNGCASIDLLEMLLDRQHPIRKFGRRDYVRRDSPGGRDFVFSAPKSVSLLWAFGSSDTRRLVEQAHNKSVLSSVELFFDMAMWERRGKGGKTLRKADGAAALFTHIATRFACHSGTANFPDARFPDPNLHTHAVVPDLVVNAENELKVAYTAVWGRWHMALGAWYHACLASSLRAEGFALDPTGGNGVFQLTGVRAEWIAAFSARTDGVRFSRRIIPGSAKPSGRSRAIEFQVTKQRYEEIETGALIEAWETHRSRHHVEVAPIEEAAKVERARARTPNKAVQGPGPSIDLQSVIAGAVEDITEFASVMQMPDLVRAVGHRLVAEGGMQAPCWALAKKAIRGFAGLQRLGPTVSYSFEQWTTPDVVACERQILALTGQLVASRHSALTIERFLGACSQPLNEDQQAAAWLAASSARIVLVEGPAGTGKTSLLGPVIAAHEAHSPGMHVIGCAEAWQPALALREKFGIECHALADLFARVRRNGDGKSKLKIDWRTMLIVDEVGLLSSRRMRDLLDLTVRTGAKLILVGDESQLDPIGAGSGLRLIKRNPDLVVCSLKKLVRQEDAAQKEAVQCLIDGDTGRFTELLTADSRWRTESSFKDANDRITRDLVVAFSGPKAGRGSVMAVVRSNREAGDISRRLRVELKKLGLLGDEDFMFHAATPMGVSVRLKLAVGDHIRFLARHAELGVYNGTRGIVERIDCGPTGIPMRLVAGVLEGADRRSIVFEPSAFHDAEGRLRIAPAYASTVYGLQGATVDEAIIFKSEKMTYRELYVAATRARLKCQIIDVDSSMAAALASGGKHGSHAVADRARRLAGAKRQKRPKALAVDFAAAEKVDATTIRV